MVIATDNIKKNSNAYKVHVYNTNTFKLEYSKDYQKHTDKYYEPNDLAIDDQAKVYVLGKLFKKGKKQNKGGEANYEFTLSKVDKASSVDLKINLENEFTHSIFSNKQPKQRHSVIRVLFNHKSWKNKRRL